MNKFVVSLIKFARSFFRPWFPLTVYGDRDIPNKRCVLVGNHVCGWDPLIYTMWMKETVSFVYKAEFNKNLLLRWALNGMDYVPVHRGEADINATKSILRLLKDDKTVCMFPEGTRNPNVDCLQDFHTGAALFALKTKSPVRAFYIWDKTKPLRKNYMIVGDEFTLDEFYGRPLDKQTLEEATAFIRNKMDELRLQLNAALEARGVKRRPRTKKELKKIQAYNDAVRIDSEQNGEHAHSEGE